MFFYTFIVLVVVNVFLQFTVMHLVSRFYIEHIYIYISVYIDLNIIHTIADLQHH